MTSEQIFIWLVMTLCALISVYLLTVHGYPAGQRMFKRATVTYDKALRQKLLLTTDPTQAVWLTIIAAIILGLVTAFLTNLFIGLLVGLGSLFLPYAVMRHLEVKRRLKLEEQLVDGLVTISSGTRAGLNLVQSMELLVKNSTAPIQQEFAQLLGEYGMGIDLNRAMRNASDRIGSQLYRLTFTAMEMHRVRGGDTAESMDRIAESIREIRKLEGKLDALTAQGRGQAIMMALAAPVLIALLYLAEPSAVSRLFVDPAGRVILLIVVSLIVGAFFWMRKILAIDI